jgi:hypothetical protein
MDRHAKDVSPGVAGVMGSIVARCKGLGLVCTSLCKAKVAPSMRKPCATCRTQEEGCSRTPLCVHSLGSCSCNGTANPGMLCRLVCACHEPAWRTGWHMSPVQACFPP